MRYPRDSPEMSMGPLQLPTLFNRFKGPNRKEVIGNLPDIDAGPRLKLALTMRLSVVIVNHDQGDSTAKAANDPRKPEQAGDTLGGAHGGRGEKPYQRHHRGDEHDHQVPSRFFRKLIEAASAPPCSSPPPSCSARPSPPASTCQGTPPCPIRAPRCTSASPSPASGPSCRPGRSLRPSSSA